MASNLQRGEKIMVFGTDKFLEANPVSHGLVMEAWKAYQGHTNNYVLTELRLSDNELISITKEEWDYLMDADKCSTIELDQLKFMLACFVLVITGKRI